MSEPKGLTRAFLFVGGKPLEAGWVMDGDAIVATVPLMGKHIVIMRFMDGRLMSLTTCDRETLESAWRLGMDMDKKYIVPERPLAEFEMVFGPAPSPLTTLSLYKCNTCGSLMDRSICQACAHHGQNSNCQSVGTVAFYSPPQ